MAGRVRVEREGRLGWIVFDHPERRNAISGEMWEAIPDAVAELASDPEVRVGLLRGEGDLAFVSGADISEFRQQRVGARAMEYEERNGNAFRALAAFPKPLVAMIHGFCVGGGLGIALQADVRYAAADAVFAVPAVKLGLGYPPESLRTLAALVGPSVAKELFFTARRLGAEEAFGLGIANAVFPKADLEIRVRERAETMAEAAPLTARAGKLTLARPAGAEGEAPEVRAAVLACFESADYQEGIAAFLEKRAPCFRGK